MHRPNNYCNYVLYPPILGAIYQQSYNTGKVSTAYLPMVGPQSWNIALDTVWSPYTNFSFNFNDDTCPNPLRRHLDKELKLCLRSVRGSGSEPLEPCIFTPTLIKNRTCIYTAHLHRSLHENSWLDSQLEVVQTIQVDYRIW